MDEDGGTIEVETNYNDIDGDTDLTFTLVDAPSNGTATVGVPGTYTPNANFHGTDTFTYTVSDAEFTSDPATVTITVNSVNDVPVVNDTTATGVKNTTFKFFLPEAYDLESGSEASFHNSLILVSAPGNGTLFKNNNEGNDSAGNSLSVGDKINNTDDGNQARIWYQPSTDWSGTDTFTYKANDGEDDSNIATVTITVTNPRLNTGWGGTWRPYTSFNVSTIETETFNQPTIAIKKSSNGQTVKSYSPALSGNIDYSFALPPIKSDDYYISVSMESADGGSNYTMTAPSNFSLVNPGLISYDGYDINNIADIVFNPNNNRVYIVGEMTPENQNSGGTVTFGMHYNIGDDAIKYDSESDTYYRNDLNVGTNNGFTLQYTSDLDAIPYDLQGTTDRMIYTSDNDIIVWDPNTYEHGSNNSEKHIVKLDWDSTLNGYEWDFDYSSWGSSNSLSSLIIADIHEVNGDFILTGYDGSNSEKKMVIIKLNSAGSVDYFNTFSSNSLGSDYYYRGFGSSIKISDSSFIIAGSSFKENFNCQNYVSVFRISDTGSSFSLIDQSNHPNPDCSLSDDAGNMYA
ncbi:MAG: cadherin-like domain-containing protein, partial [Candidatus Heimdallarchaeota archaeon]